MTKSAFSEQDMAMQSQFTSPEFEDKERTKSASAFKVNAPSPDGAASQGALGAPAKAGGSSDMLGMFNESDDDGREAVTRNMTESLEPHGKSLEGGLEDVLMPGGQPNLQAMARAADFGIDLKGLAAKTSGADAQKAQKNVGVAFGQIPEEGQTGPVKSEAKAFQDMSSREKEQARTQAADAEKAKKDRRNRIAAFLMETGLRVLASDRSDAGAAIGESALGTIESGRSRKRQEEADEMARTEAAAKAKRDEQQYDISAEEERRAQEEHEAKQAAGTLSGRGGTSFEVQRDTWMAGNLPKGASEAVKQKEIRKFMDTYYRNNFKPAQLADAIDDYITRKDEPQNYDEDWDKLTDDEKYAQATKKMKALLKDDAADNDPLGLL